MGTVAGAEPTAEITGFSNGDTSQMCAHTHHDEPLGLLYSVRVALGVTEGFDSVIKEKVVVSQGVAV